MLQMRGSYEEIHILRLNPVVFSSFVELIWNCFVMDVFLSVIFPETVSSYPGIIWQYN